MGEIRTSKGARQISGLQNFQGTQDGPAAIVEVPRESQKLRHTVRELFACSHGAPREPPAKDPTSSAFAWSGVQTCRQKGVSSKLLGCAQALVQFLNANSL